MKYISDDETVNIEGVEFGRLVGVFGSDKSATVVAEVTKVTNGLTGEVLTNINAAVVLVVGVKPLEVAKRLVDTINDPALVLVSLMSTVGAVKVGE